jgi:hypothetical protein
MNFQGTRWGKGVERIDLVQDTDKRSLLVDMAMNA